MTDADPPRAPSFGGLLCVIFSAVWLIAMGTTSDSLSRLLTINLAAQLSLFVLVAALPFWKTGRMSFVDLAWPFGVALIGALVLILGDGHPLRRTIVGGVYLLIGLRMGLGAIVFGIKTGVIFRTEFPRYAFRRLIMTQTMTDAQFRRHALAEIMAQGMANASVLALPAFMIGLDPAAGVSGWEVAGLCIWAAAYVLESTADAQKLLFIQKNPGGVCDVGLWRYSRHPNYFAEWLVWTGLVVATVPAWLALRAVEPTHVWITLGVGALGASGALYLTLVYLTGAVPAEYYSVRKRPGYAAYQQRTNRFFPWFPKDAPPPPPRSS